MVAAATMSSGSSPNLMLDRINPHSPRVRLSLHRYVAELSATPNEAVVNVARKNE